MDPRRAFLIGYIDRSVDWAKKREQVMNIFFHELFMIDGKYP